MTTLDIDTVQAFLLVAELQSFTRAAEALGTTQAAVSLKLQRLEAVLGKRLVERSPRAVRLTADGAAFLTQARALIEAHDRALSGEKPVPQQLSLGISDHAAGPELVPLLERLHAMSSQLALAVTIGFSRAMLDAYDAGKLDAVIVRQEGSRRGGEKLTEDEFGWFASRASSGHAASPCRSQRWRRPAASAPSRFARSTRPASPGAKPLSAAASPPWSRPPRPDLRSRPWHDGSHRRDWSTSGRRWAAAARGFKGDAALEGQRSLQTRRAADAGGDVPERGGRVSRLSQDRLERAAKGFVAEHKTVAQCLVRQHALPAQQQLVGEIAAEPAQQTGGNAEYCRPPQPPAEFLGEFRYW